MEVRRGHAPRSRLYESRASLSTLADRKGWSSRWVMRPVQALIQREAVYKAAGSASNFGRETISAAGLAPAKAPA